jgi:hypothetical protein
MNLHSDMHNHHSDTQEHDHEDPSQSGSTAALQPRLCAHAFFSSTPHQCGTAACQELQGGHAITFITLRIIVLLQGLSIQPVRQAHNFHCSTDSTSSRGWARSKRHGKGPMAQNNVPGMALTEAAAGQKRALSAGQCLLSYQF